MTVLSPIDFDYRFSNHSNVSGNDDIAAVLKRRGVLPAAELREALSVSPASLSRSVAADVRVARLGRARASRYGLRRAVPGLSGHVPIWRVGIDGKPRRAAQLVPLAGGQHWVEPRKGSGYLFEGLPPVVHDMAPQGYLGRRFSNAHPDLNLPRRLQDWNDEHALIAVARRGEDCIGDLVLGEESLDRLLAAEPEAVSREDYPSLARESAAGGVCSSAGGEMPKFAAFAGGRHVLVKFTVGDGSPSDQRWRNLLREDAVRIQLLDALGALIGNGDRHFGNISFFASGLAQHPPLTLAPAYDMLPMDFAPHAGFVPETRLPMPKPKARLLEAWDEASDLAEQYWARIAEDERIGEALRLRIR